MPQTIGNTCRFATSALLIEDDFIHGGLMKAALAAAGFNVHMAVTEAEAIDVLTLFHPDLILIDWDVLGINGVAFMSSMRQQIGSLTQVPVILMTSREITEKMAARLACIGFRWILQKPVSVEDLEAAVKQAKSAAINLSVLTHS